MCLGDLVAAPGDREEPEDLLALGGMVAALPELERQIIVLRFFQDLDQDTIAAKVGFWSRRCLPCSSRDSRCDRRLAKEVVDAGSVDGDRDPPVGAGRGPRARGDDARCRLGQAPVTLQSDRGSHQWLAMTVARDGLVVAYRSRRRWPGTTRRPRASAWWWAGAGRGELGDS